MTDKKTALITGVCRGIGEAICYRLLEQGYVVFGVHKGEHGKLELEKKIEKGEISGITLFKLDLSDKNQIDELVIKLKDQKFDAVVNNAGIIEFENFDNYNFAIWEKTFAVNLNAPFILTMKLIHNLKKGAAIVMVASSDGLVGSFASMAYSASKAALINLTKSLGNNLGQKDIRVNAVAPGWINTGMSTEESLKAVKLTPLGRNGKPEEVAQLVSFLLSSKASFMNGSTIAIDGGYSNVDYIMKQEAKSS